MRGKGSCKIWCVLRIQKYHQISKSLSSLTDQELSDCLNGASSLHAGIGGNSLFLELEESPVFVKRIALCDIERELHHALSTANIFDLPAACHYGIGSPGFSAWRELASHQMTTNWVLEEGCVHFPLLYHWRILPEVGRAPLNIEPWRSLDEYCQFWDNSIGVRQRVEAINGARHSIILFIEHFPHNLQDWLAVQLSGDALEALGMVEANIENVSKFMEDHGFFHYDAHFANILTDGSQIYLSDFGLAAAVNFDLTEAEKAFIAAHRSYDRFSMLTSLVHSIIVSQFGGDDWHNKLSSYLSGEGLIPSSGTVLQGGAFLNKYGPMALCMGDFIRQLRRQKNTPYPYQELKRLFQYT